jgi:hypothetical protein
MQGCSIRTRRWNINDKGNKMTEKTPDEIFKEMNLSKILVAMLEELKEVNISAATFIDAAKRIRSFKLITIQIINHLPLS